MSSGASEGPSGPSFYDKFEYNSLHFKKKKNGTHEFGNDIEAIIPTAGEIRLLGNRHKQCTYYQIGKLHPSLILNRC